MENKEMTEINGKLDLILTKIDQSDRKFDQIDKKFDQIDKKFDQIDKRFDQIDNKLDGIDKRLVNVELTIENEIRPNIQILAEGQSIIMRKLDELTKVRDEHDYTKIRLDVLESRVNRLEKKVS